MYYIEIVHLSTVSKFETIAGISKDVAKCIMKWCLNEAHASQGLRNLVDNETATALRTEFMRLFSDST